MKKLLSAMFVALLMVLCFYLAGCEGSLSEEIVGTWVGKNEADGTMTFHSNGVFELLSKDGGETGDADMKVTWEVVDEIQPAHLYISVELNEKVHRVPLGIFTIEGGDLILRQPKEYKRHIGFMPIGNIRYEMPTDFAGIVNVYQKVD
jgi:hypothetical protein